jgi:O-antigen/teichoic acid export membrane protein
MIEIKASIRYNTLWNFVGSLIPLLIGLASIPFLLHKIGVERFGVLTLVWTLIGYFSIFDFGIGRALTYQVSNSLSKNVRSELLGIVKEGLKLMLITGILGGLLLALISKQLGYSWLNVSQNLSQESYVSILFSSFAIPLTTYTSGLKGILEGFEDFKIVNLLKLLLGIFNFGLPVLAVIFYGPSLFYIVLSLILSRFIIFILHFVFVNKRISIKSVFKSEAADKKGKKELMNFGIWMTLSNIVSPLMVSADRFIISFIIGASAVAYYTVPFDMVIRLLVIPASLTTVLFPRFSTLLVTDRSSAIKLFKKSKKIIFISMLFISICLIVFSHFGLTMWIGKDLADKSWKIMSVLSIGLLFNSLAQVPYALIQSAGKVKLTSMIHLCEFLFYVIMLLILLKNFGIIGAAIAFVLRVLFDYLILNYFSKKILKAE